MKTKTMHKYGLALLFVMMAGVVRAQIPELYRRQLIEQNPALQAQRKMVEAYRQRSLQAGYLAEPTVSVGWFLLPVETRLGAQRLRLSVNQMLPWWGTLKAGRRAAAAEARAQALYWQAGAAREWMLFSKTYWAWFEWQAWYAIELENVQWLEQYEPILRSRLASGKASMADYLRLDVQLQEARLSLEALKQKAYPWQVQLNRMLNRPDSTRLLPPDTLLPPDSLLLAVDSLMADAHPRVQALEHLQAAAAEQQTLAKLQRKPRFGLGLDYVVVSKRQDMNVEQNGRDILMPMLSVSLPLWGKRYRAAEAEALARQQSVEYEMRQTLNELQSQAAQVQFELWESYRYYRLYGENIDKVHTTLQLLLTAYGQGQSDFEEVLRVQQQLFEYKKKQISAYVRFQKAKADWEYLNTQTY
ncbi:TolC family protein [Thermonema rossianum]|uniref:TolC family protein n=1 Tax=Thermonema rossianum TaxID=55505 RepID=UPI0009FC4C45|nr:TolC family protein [Thermonema rossianum]